MSARRLAIDALVRIDEQGAYANLVVPAMLRTAQLDQRDRGFVTELVYGVTRMRRSCDFLVDRFLMSPVEPRVRAALRLGAYQLAFLDTPPHAAVSETVGATPKRARGLVNAVLRKVAGASMEYPDEGTRLSYPDWLIERLVDDLGRADAIAALETMNTPAVVTERADGYVQDPSSTAVAQLVDGGGIVLDLCAAPGGKATALTAEFVVASDVAVSRTSLMAGNVARLGRENVSVMVADGLAPPFPPASFDAVLVDAPCSGLGALRRRPDARWRIDEAAIGRLAELQVLLVRSAQSLVKPGGQLVFSVCTLTDAESVGVDVALGDLTAEPLSDAWPVHGRGGRLLPGRETDGMCAFVYRL